MIGYTPVIQSIYKNKQFDYKIINTNDDSKDETLINIYKKINNSYSDKVIKIITEEKDKILKNIENTHELRFIHNPINLYIKLGKVIIYQLG